MLLFFCPYYRSLYGARTHNVTFNKSDSITVGLIQIDLSPLTGLTVAVYTDDFPDF